MYYDLRIRYAARQTALELAHAFVSEHFLLLYIKSTKKVRMCERTILCDMTCHVDFFTYTYTNNLC